MKRYFFVISIIAGLLTPVGAHAGPQAYELGACLTDALNGKERKSLAKWIFFGMSAHSSIEQYSNISAEDIETSDRYVGYLVTRLLTENCPGQAKLAFEEGGTGGIEYAFRVVGQVAMQEIMAEPGVSQSLGAFEKYLDRDRFNQIFQ
ncbi:MAG: hypothetical protein AMS22_02315 [Thiotrichales bacterium SG8_50]|nr:MAG: hypothetical protein AMS22_02315 [Thiotrichales bacterium SG8_50]